MILTKSKIYELRLFRKIVQNTFHYVFKASLKSFGFMDFLIDNGYNKFVQFLKQKEFDVHKYINSRTHSDSRRFLSYMSTHIESNVGLACAGRGGYPELIDRFLFLGAKNKNWSFRCAVYNEKINIMQYFISQKCSFDNIIVYIEDGKIKKYIEKYLKF